MERLSPHPAAHCIRVDPPPPGEGKERPRLRDLAECFFREVFIYSRPLRIEGAGNAGRPMRPIAACAHGSKKCTRVSRSHRNHPAFPTQWFTDYIVLSPVLRAFWPPSPRGYSTKLDTSVGVSGPHVYILVFGETRRS